MDKILKDEMREQENEAMLNYLEQLQREDWEEAKKRKEQQKKLAVRSHFCFSNVQSVQVNSLNHLTTSKNKTNLVFCSFLWNVGGDFRF